METASVRTQFAHQVPFAGKRCLGKSIVDLLQVFSYLSRLGNMVIMKVIGHLEQHEHVDHLHAHYVTSHCGH